MPTTRGISDKGLAVFVFAAYHELESGSRVTEIVRRTVSDTKLVRRLSANSNNSGSSS